MPTITCPECDARLKLAADLPPGKRVKCSKGGTAFAPAPEEQGELFVERTPSKPAKKSRVADEDEFDDESEARPSRRRPRAEDDDEPEDRPRARRRRTDDEPEERPVRRTRKRRKSSGSSGKVLLIVGLSVGAILLVGGIAVALVFVVRSVGGGYAKHEQATKDMIGMLNELAAALESVKDRQSAQTAATRIEKVCDRMEEMENAYRGCRNCRKRMTSASRSNIRPN